MATNFKVWIDDATIKSNTANVMSTEAFSEDESRAAGWKAGDTISSSKMNSILRQNSLIAAALAEAFLSNTTLGMLSSVDEVKNALLAAIATKAAVEDVDSSLTAASDEVLRIQNVLNTLNESISRILDGSSTVANAAKLGGNAASYYQKSITFGTSEPSGGSDGDIYIKYS